MTDEEYKMLYRRIRTDLYNEFINPETATYGLDVVRQQESKYYSTNDLLLEEIERKVALEKYGSEGSGKNLPFSSLSDDLKKKKKEEE